MTTGEVRRSMSRETNQHSHLPSSLHPPDPQENVILCTSRV